jgi:NAD(P) transhydrogenase subunit alpha
MIIGVPRETISGERRVALVPDCVASFRKVNLEVVVESGAGVAAGFPNTAYEDAGAKVVADVLAGADLVMKVAAPTPDEIHRLKEGATLVGMLSPATNAAGLEALAARQITAFAMERMPRISRAQPMDALSAMSTVAGYRAVLIAANHLSRFFPLLMTAAGTITPARVLVIGAGVAGLQAIATARRLGAVVEAYDTRPAVREQVESLGAKFVDLPIQAADAEAKTGYATGQSEDFYQRQRQLLSERVAQADVVITTALVPGQKAPLLVPASAVRAMRPGSVVVDLAAEQGGNCEVTRAGETFVENSVTVVGPLNLPSSLPYHASQLYAGTIMNFVLHICKGGSVAISLDDELTRGPLVTYQGKVVLS